MCEPRFDVAKNSEYAMIQSYSTRTMSGGIRVVGQPPVEKRTEYVRRPRRKHEARLCCAA